MRKVLNSPEYISWQQQHDQRVWELYMAAEANDVPQPKWEGRIIVHINAPNRVIAKRLLRQMMEAYGFAEKPNGVSGVSLGNVTKR